MGHTYDKILFKQCNVVKKIKNRKISTSGYERCEETLMQGRIGIYVRYQVETNKKYNTVKKSVKIRLQYSYTCEMFLSKIDKGLKKRASGGER